MRHLGLHCGCEERDCEGRTVTNESKHDHAASLVAGASGVGANHPAHGIGRTSDTAPSLRL